MLNGARAILYSTTSWPVVGTVLPTTCCQDVMKCARNVMGVSCHCNVSPGSANPLDPKWSSSKDDKAANPACLPFWELYPTVPPIAVFLS